ncbi:hypothetical protein KKC94_05760 [Patescibacteria group bacterium]|nr:hypothetical protein [Patescibacteria group bacterium]
MFKKKISAQDTKVMIAFLLGFIVGGITIVFVLMYQSGTDGICSGNFFDKGGSAVWDGQIGIVVQPSNLNANALRR